MSNAAPRPNAAGAQGGAGGGAAGGAGGVLIRRDGVGNPAGATPPLSEESNFSTDEDTRSPFDDAPTTSPMRLHEVRRYREDAQTVLATLRKTTKEEAQKRVILNQPLAGISPGDYSIDHERGLISFGHPVGQISPAGVEAVELARIVASPPPRVRITFAYRDSPAAREALARLGGDTGGPQVGAGAGQLPPAAHGQGEVQHYFSALGRREKNGGISWINQGLHEPATLSEAERYPLVIHDDGLQVYVTLDGRSNVAEVEKRAQEIGRQHLLGANEQDGEDGTAVGFYPIQPSSRIPRVEWSGGDGQALTRWTVDNPAAAKATLAARIVSGEV